MQTTLIIRAPGGANKHRSDLFYPVNACPLLRYRRLWHCWHLSRIGTPVSALLAPIKSTQRHSADTMCTVHVLHCVWGAAQCTVRQTIECRCRLNCEREQPRQLKGQCYNQFLITYLHPQWGFLPTNADLKCPVTTSSNEMRWLSRKRWNHWKLEKVETWCPPWPLLHRPLTISPNTRPTISKMSNNL